MAPSKILSVFICFLLLSCSKETVNNFSPVTIDKAIADSSKVVVILGSSTAFGTGATPIDSSWVNKLREKFRDDAKNIIIYNLAQSGYTTYHILPSNVNPTAGRPVPDITRNLDKALTFKPHLIIINLPSNDVTNGYSDKEIIENYKQLAVEIEKHNVQFLVTSTQPRNYAESHTRLRLAFLNNLVRNELPHNMVEIYPLLADSANYIKAELNSGDGIHLNNKGHRIIFEEFFKDRKMRLTLGY